MFDHIQPIGLTDRAAEEVLRIMKTKQIPEGYGLRLGSRGGGCGVSLILGFDKQKESDLTYTLHGIHIFIDKKHTLFLVGKEVDFYDGAEARGFMFVDKANPFTPSTTI